jgi:uncharacterized membrane protein (DUF485 family)
MRNAWALAIIATVFLKNVYDEVRKFIGFWKCKWMREYRNTNTLKNWGSMAAVAALLVLLVLPNPPDDQGYLRTLLAAAGFFKWLKIVTYFRGIQSLRLGQKFLPISYTLQEGTSFLLVMIFFILAAWHAFYSLYPETVTGTSWTHLFSMTYNLGFLGEFDLNDLLSESATDGANSWAWVQQILFAFAAMLVMVMLTNIYIGVMGNAYNDYHAKALELFVRARASICLDISLQYGTAWQGCSVTRGIRGEAMLRDEYVWFCSAASEYDTAEEDGSSSVNRMVRELQEAVETQKVESSSSINRMVRELQAMETQKMESSASVNQMVGELQEAMETQKLENQMVREQLQQIQNLLSEKRARSYDVLN